MYPLLSIPGGHSKYEYINMERGIEWVVAHACTYLAVFLIFRKKVLTSSASN